MSLLNQIQAATYTLEGPGVNPGPNGAAAGERILSVVIGVISMVAFIYFIFHVIFAGYEMISANGDPKRLEGARKRLTDGILGLVIIIVAVTLANLLGRLAGIPNILDLSSFFNSVHL